MLSSPLPPFGPAVSFSASVNPLCPNRWSWLLLLLYVFFLFILNPFLLLKPVVWWLVHLSVCPLDRGCSRQGTCPVNGEAYGGHSITGHEYLCSKEGKTEPCILFVSFLQIIQSWSHLPVASAKQQKPELLPDLKTSNPDPCPAPRGDHWWGTWGEQCSC